MPQPPHKLCRILSKWAFLALALCVVALPARAQTAQDDTFACLNELTGPLERLTGDIGYATVHRRQAVDGSRFDARGLTVLQETKPAIRGAAYPVDVRLPAPSARTCWAGGLIQNTNAYTISWSTSKHPNNAALIFKEGYPIADGVRIHNAHDGIRPYHRASDGAGLSGFEIRNSWLSYIRDDCIENDSAAGGLIEDSLFDGCYVFLSARGGDGVPGSKDNVITIRDSLIYLKEMPGPYGHDGEPLLGHGQLFKFDEMSPKLALENNIILIEDYPVTKHDRANWVKNAPDALSLRPERLAHCRGNTIVWLGPGKFPGWLPRDKDCASVTTDKSVWTQSRAAWISAHPLVARVLGVDSETIPPVP